MGNIFKSSSVVNWFQKTYKNISNFEHEVKDRRTIFGVAKCEKLFVFWFV